VPNRCGVNTHNAASLNAQKDVTASAAKTCTGGRRNVCAGSFSDAEPTSSADTHGMQMGDVSNHDPGIIVPRWAMLRAARGARIERDDVVRIGEPRVLELTAKPAQVEEVRVQQEHGRPGAVERRCAPVRAVREVPCARA
jgi:hypothetical protein